LIKLRLALNWVIEMLAAVGDPWGKATNFDPVSLNKSSDIDWLRRYKIDRSMKVMSSIILFFCVSMAGWAQEVPSEDITVSLNDTAGGTSEGAPLPLPVPSPQHPAAKIYPPGYETRAKIHRYASFATLPLFATELWLGQSLYNAAPGTEQSKKGAHIAVGTGIIGLFGVNTVTGVWNMWSSRKDPDGRALRMTHGILMLASNAGFLATAATGPGEHGRRVPMTFAANRATHRDIAISSIGVGTIGYLVMLIGGRH
jgi:hypothetical protein